MLATSEDNIPITCVIDIMLEDEHGLYFLTAKGKSLYNRLKCNQNIALSGIKGDDTMSSKSITIRGKVKEVGKDLLAELFKENEYMYSIYPTEESRKALSVFQIYEGEGEFFDLSVRPIFRESFSFAKDKAVTKGYSINAQRSACGSCLKHCPQGCIKIVNNRAKINQNNCLHCGNCFERCPCNAVERSIK